MRSERDSLFQIGLLSNRPLLGAVALTVGLQLMVIYSPVLQPDFQTTALSAGDLAISLGLRHRGLLGGSNCRSGSFRTAAAKGCFQKPFPTPDRSNRRMD